MKQRMLDFFFPARCGGCGRCGTGLCRACVAERSDVVRRLSTFDVRALATYTHAVRRAVHALKDGRRDVARSFGQRLAPFVSAGDILVPVPTTRARRRVRGIDGVVEMARTASLFSGATVIEALVCATSDRQRGKTRSQRIASFGRFRCRSVLAGCEIVLVDDVCTTGTTLEDCAGAVRAAGGRVRGALVVALVDGAQDCASVARSAVG